MKKDWTEDIRKKMESYEHPSPEMVWSDMELPMIAKGKKGNYGTKWKVAAAIIFLIGLTATLPLFTDQEQAEDKMSYDNIVSLNKDKETKGNSQIQTAPINFYAELNGHTVMAKETITAEEVKEETAKKQKQTTDNTDINVKAQPTNKTGKKKKGSVVPTHSINPISNKQDSRLTAKAYISNMNSTSNSMFNLPDPSINAPGSTTDTKHKQPIKIGLSLNFRLSSKWGVGLGLSYSLLKSDIRTDEMTKSTITEQKLHYIGITTNMNYCLWQSNHWTVYASAGATIEKAISAKAVTTEKKIGSELSYVSDNSLSTSALQFSVNGNIGLEYRLTKRMGLYIESGYNYNFDNHSHITTIYQDKPFNLNVNVGISLRLEQNE